MTSLQKLEQLAEGDRSAINSFPVVSVCLYHDGMVEVMKGNDTKLVTEHEHLRNRSGNVLIIDLMDDDKGQS